ncbi:hypothetical protein BD779DRAFT_1677838 [Infundibulicybe gibba]|nr:hypothetical protein BD779DRAFT_1677838 [Infundibulicybe gibba]
MSAIPVPDNLSQIFADGRLTNYAAIASITLLAFDHILTFGEEVELIWKSRWNIFKVVYLWQRYFALISLSGLTVGELLDEIKALDLEAIITTVIIFVVDFVLVVRVWTLYARSRRVLVFLVILTILEAVAMLIVGEITLTIGMRGFRTPDISTTPLCDIPDVALRFVMFYPVAPLIVV